MKKLLSLVCALALALGLALPALAEGTGGTPGQIVAGLVQQLSGTTMGADREQIVLLAQQLAAQYNADKSLYVDATASKLLWDKLWVDHFADSYDGTAFCDVFRDSTTEIEELYGLAISYYTAPGVTAPFKRIDGNRQGNTLSLIFGFEGGVQPPCGGCITIDYRSFLSSNSVPPLEEGLNYIWECEGQTGHVFNDTYNKCLSFYAPRPGSYTIAPVPPAGDLSGLSIAELAARLKAEPTNQALAVELAGRLDNDPRLVFGYDVFSAMLSFLANEQNMKNGLVDFSQLEGQAGTLYAAAGAVCQVSGIAVGEKELRFSLSCPQGGGSPTGYLLILKLPQGHPLLADGLQLQFSGGGRSGYAGRYGHMEGETFVTEGINLFVPGTGAYTVSTEQGPAPETPAEAPTIPQLVEQLLKNPLDRQTAAELVERLNQDKGVPISEAITSAIADAIERVAHRAEEIPFGGFLVKILAPATITARLEISRLTQSGAQAEIELQYTGGAQSPMGTMVTIRLKDPLDTGRRYCWQCDGQTGVVRLSADGREVTFFAPHFSSYTIVPTEDRDYYYEYLANNGLLGADNAAIEAYLNGGRGGSLLADTSAGGGAALPAVGLAGLALLGGSAALLKGKRQRR